MKKGLESLLKKFWIVGSIISASALLSNKSKSWDFLLGLFFLFSASVSWWVSELPSCSDTPTKEIE